MFVPMCELSVDGEDSAENRTSGDVALYGKWHNFILKSAYTLDKRIDHREFVYYVGILHLLLCLIYDILHPLGLKQQFYQ